MESKKLKVVYLDNYSCTEKINYATLGSSGIDLRASIDAKIVLYPLKRVIIPTGIQLEIPLNNEGLIRPRSGLAAKHGITVLNTPGTIDSDYRGEIKVILINLGEEKFEILPNMKIAQIIIAPYTRVEVVETNNISSTQRGDQGFGSTGLK